MMGECDSVFRIVDVSHIDAARRAIVRAAMTLTANETLLGRLTLIAQEMGRNLVNHAGGGELIYSQTDAGLRLLAVDRGPGMANVQACLADNYSTAGTLGAGLGGIQRLSDRFDIFSQPGRGTAVFAQIDLRAQDPDNLQVGALCTALQSESVCGDAWARRDNRFMVVDGLGHGHHAHAASSKARDIFLRHDSQQSLGEIVEQLHRALTATRGAAVAIAQIDAQRGEVQFCGMGNVAGMLIDETSRSMVSANGTLGYRMGRVRAFSYPWQASTLLIMASDGISAKFKFGDYPGLKSKHPALIAAVIHRDFRRLNDDATVIVARYE